MADAEPQDALMWFEVGGGTGEVIEGESKDSFAATVNAFELTEFSIKAENATNVGSSTGGGAGAGKVKFDRLTCKKFSDKATVQLFHGLAHGHTWEHVYIQLRSNNEPYIEIKFVQCLLSELEFSQSGEDQAEDSFVVDWGAMEMIYKEQGALGGFGESEPKVAEWSRVKNIPACEI